jgi:tetratricopeptide (TPR) repeat protein
MSSLLNPYIAGAPVVEPSMFFGRHDVFQWIEHSLEGKFVNHILVIHGQRRVGKTSVLKQIPNTLPKSYIQVFFDLQGRTSTTLDRFLWWLAREISRVLKQEHGLVVPVPEREAFTSDPEILLTQFLPALQPLLGERKLLLTFDEFDTLEQPDIRETLARPLILTLRRMFELESLSFIFSIGSSGHKLENMQASYTDFFKTALYRKISFLDREDCFQLITRPVSEILEYEPKARQRIYEVTAGHPYFTQLVCHELFSLCQKTGKRSLSAEDVDGILDDVIERGTVNLKFTWDEAPSLEKWMLACLAQPPSSSPLEGGRVLVELQEMLHQQRVRYSDPDFNAALIHLRDKDILSEENRFVIYLLQRWLRKNRPLDRVREELVEVNPIANRYLEIGEEYRSLGQAGKAIESFQKALEVDPLNLKAQVGIAHVHLEKNDHLAAMQAFEKALGIDDEDVTARSGLCDACLALGDAASKALDWDGAREHYRRILAVNPEHSEARQRLAQVYCQQAEIALQQQQYKSALGFFGEALHVTPEDEALQQRIWQFQMLLRDKAITALLTESQGEAAAGQWPAAIERLQGGLQAYPDEPRLQEALAEVLTAQRQAKLVSLRMQAEKLAAAEQWTPALEAWQAYLSFEPPDTDQVAEEMQRLEAQRSLAEAYVQGQQALEAKDFSRAASLLKKVVLVDENYKDGARLLAQAIEGKRQQKPAVRLPVIHLPKVHRRVWKPALLGLAGVLLLAGLAFVGVKLASLVETQNIASLPTPTTPDAMPTQAPTAGVNPRIAYLIETQEPTFSDDFTTWNPVWGEPRPGVVDVWSEGGQMVLTPPEGGNAILESAAINAYHFALQYTLMFDIPQGLDDPDKYAVFSHSFRAYPETGGYELYVELNDAADNLYNWKLIGAPGELSGTTSLLEQGEANLVTVAYLGDECVIWINHQVLVHFYDQQHNGTINRLSAHTDQGMLKVIIDDLKFWILQEGNQAAMPTPAPTQQAAQPWVADFANPILESIALAQPSFQDDFSYPRAEWQPQGDFTLDQGMAVFSAESDTAQPYLGGSPLQAGAFALQFDLRVEFPQGEGQDDIGEGETMLALDLTFSADEWYTFYLGFDDLPGEITAHIWSVYQFPENILVAQGETLPLDPAGWTQVKVLFKDGTWGFYLAGQPLGYVDGLPATSQNIAISAGTKESPFVLFIDDLQFWDLENLSSGSSVEPLPDFLQGRAPDFSDDFETLNAEWLVENGESSLENGRLLLATGPDGFARMGAAPLAARDFQLQYDFQVLAQGDGGATMSLELRIIEQSKYVLTVSYQSDPVTWSFAAIDQADLGTELSSGSLPGWDPLASHQLGVLAVDSQFWLTLDGSLLTNLQDSRLAEGGIALVVKSGNDAATVAIDNFSFWNLDQVPLVSGFGSAEEESFTRAALSSLPAPDFTAFGDAPTAWWTGGSSGPNPEYQDGATRFAVPGGLNYMFTLEAIEPAQDFVLQFDFDPVQVDPNMMIAVGFRHTGDESYHLRFEPEYNYIILSLSNVPGELARVEHPLSGWSRVLLIVRGDTIAVYLNGEPQIFIRDSTLTGAGNIWFQINAPADVSCLFDNLLFWNLDDIP